MSNISQSQSGLQAGNPPASPGITHSDVVVNVFRGFSSRNGIPGASAPSTSLPGSPVSEVPLTSANVPVGGPAPLTPPPIQSSVDLESAETINVVTAQVPVSFEPFGSEVLKSLHEFGLGGSAFNAPALPPPFEPPVAPDYYFLPKP